MLVDERISNYIIRIIKRVITDTIKECLNIMWENKSVSIKLT